MLYKATEDQLKQDQYPILVFFKPITIIPTAIDIIILSINITEESQAKQSFVSGFKMNKNKHKLGAFFGIKQSSANESIIHNSLKISQLNLLGVVQRTSFYSRLF